MRQLKWYRIDYVTGGIQTHYHLQAGSRAQARELFGSEFTITKVSRCLPVRPRTQQQLIQAGRR